MGKENRGQVIIVFVLCLLVLLGFVALAIDVGYLFSVRSDLQRSADAGALAGAYVLNDGKWDDKGDIKEDRTKEKAAKRALTIASRDPVGDKPLVAGTVSRNGEVMGGEIDVDIEKDYKNWENRIRVTTSRNLDLFFAGVFGIPTVSLSATATAAVEPVDKDVICLSPLAFPDKKPDDKDLEQGWEVKDYKIANTPPVAGGNSDKIIYPLRFCGDTLPEFYSRILDPCMDKGSCRFKIGDPVVALPMPPSLPANTSALRGVWQLAYDSAKGDPDSRWDPSTPPDCKDLPCSSKFGGDTWMYSPRVMRVVLYDKDVAEASGTIIVKGFAAFWIGWRDGEQAKYLNDIINKPDDVEVKGRFLSANAVGDLSTPPVWPPNPKIPSLNITRLVQ